MIDRAEATRAVLDLAAEAPIISSVGNATFDLYAAAPDRAASFYMWNSMGMASSAGLGLALARPDLRVVVLDGDGACLMNLSSLATAGMAGVRNLIHIVWNNGGWEITGAQPAATSFGIDLEAIARGCGYRNAATVESLDAFGQVVGQALAASDSWFIVARIGQTGAAHLRPTKTLPLIRERFMAAVAASGGR